MQKKLFGTDGIRGKANQYPVTPEIALKLGRAIAHVFHHTGARPQIVIGKDTRLSGYMLESALVSGITAMGVDVALLGPLPTPAVAHLTRTLRAAAGIMISASHNPFEDNGIKIFQGDGYKCPDELEKKIEDLVLENSLDRLIPASNEIGHAVRIDHADARYAEMAKDSFPATLNLVGLKIAVDCANGAAYKTTPRVLSELGAEVSVFHNEPNGTNINERCGSTHPEVIQALVRQTGAHLGISHDGDADRLICSDEAGVLVDGDEILAMIALDHLRRGTLAGNTLVATVMSNFGLDECLAAAGGKVVRTDVGDRYVIEEMVKHNLNVGGEQSGHLIFRDHATTGDGLISALQVLRIMKESGQPLSQLRTCLKKYPQLLINEKIREKRPLDQIPSVQDAIRAVEKEIGSRGRVFLRYSGTENKVRLLLEAPDNSRFESWAEQILAPLRKELGAP
jgi:phosphoglucosamine mutase